MSSRIPRRKFLKNSGKAAVALAVFPSIPAFASTSFDVVLKGGTILDGTGSPAWKSDVGIVGDTITAIGSIAPEQGKKVIDVSNLYVCPGFIDIHSHSDYSIPAYPTADSRVRQGITTEITGNCGSSAAPMTGLGREDSQKGLKEEYDYDAQWTDVASYFETLEKKKISLNQALLLGQGTIRSSIIGLEDRRVTPDELNAILRIVEEGMDQGAVGLSTGLEYTPGRYTPTEEIVQMTRVVARRGGFYASHIRNEEKLLLEAVNEAIDIGRQTGARVEISHLKAAGRVNWDKQRASLQLIEAARSEEGVEVLADAYPYTAYSTGLTVNLENWALDGGTEALMKRLKNPADRERIRKEVDPRIRYNEPGGYDLMVISEVYSEKNKNCIGKNIEQIAEMWNIEPVDAFLRLLEEENASVGYVGHGMSPENVKMILSHPLVMISTDGYSIAPTGKVAETKPHPRSYGTYPRVLGYYCREERIFELPVAVKKITSMPADQTGLPDRGRLGRGKKADIVVFDAATVKDVATYEDPHRYPVGIPYVVVNGVIVVSNGNHTGATPGRILRKT